jgi:hypothetical protein
MLRIPSTRLGGFRAFLGELEERSAAPGDGEVGAADEARLPSLSPPGWLTSLSVTLTIGHLRPGQPASSRSARAAEPYRDALEGAISPSGDSDARSEEDIVAIELGLAPAMSRNDILHIRRIFASRYHPDRFPPALQAEAHRRMALANTLFDRALRNCDSASAP